MACSSQPPLAITAHRIAHSRRLISELITSSILIARPLLVSPLSKMKLISSQWMLSCFVSFLPLHLLLFTVLWSSRSVLDEGKFQFSPGCRRDNRPPGLARLLAGLLDVCSISRLSAWKEEKILSLPAGRPAKWTLSHSWDLHWKTCALQSARKLAWHCGQNSWFSFPSGHYSPFYTLFLYLSYRYASYRF